jgi:hypothetical protein
LGAAGGPRWWWMTSSRAPKSTVSKSTHARTRAHHARHRDRHGSHRPRHHHHHHHHGHRHRHRHSPSVAWALAVLLPCSLDIVLAPPPAPAQSALHSRSYFPAGSGSFHTLDSQLCNVIAGIGRRHGRHAHSMAAHQKRARDGVGLGVWSTAAAGRPRAQARGEVPTCSILVSIGWAGRWTPMLALASLSGCGPDVLHPFARRAVDPHLRVAPRQLGGGVQREGALGLGLREGAPPPSHPSLSFLSSPLWALVFEKVGWS